MNNKMSFYLLFAMLFVAFSCKSEAKPEANPEEVVATETVPENDLSDVKETMMMEVVQREEEPVVEIEKPVKSKNSSRAKKQPAVDPGIQIEMGEDANHDVDETVEEESPMPETGKEKTTEEQVVEENDKPSRPEKIHTAVGAPKHSLLDRLLKTHVSSSGVVDYRGLKGSQDQLDEYLKILEMHPPESSWSRDEKLAYWINAYNAYTIKLILKNYPVTSITEISGGKPWDAKWINLDGRTLSLNNIENDIIRPDFNEPRIHFAVNCAAKSCPPLLNEAYKARSLEAQLESQTKKFINNPAFNSLGKNEIEVSKIFEWYKEDFGNVVSFVIRYADKTIKKGAAVKYKEYDWALNSK